MICNSCSKKSVCKYIDIINDLPREIVAQIISCGFSSNNIAQETSSKPVQPTYRQPIKYTEDNVVLLHDDKPIEEEERIIVDLNDLDNLKEKTVSMLDILTSEGEDE